MNRRSGSQAMARRQGIFLKDVRYLSVRAARAIRDGDKPAVDEVLRLLEDLMLEAIQYHAERRPAETELLIPRDGPGVHSREWRELMQALVGVQEATALTESPRIRGDVLDAILRTTSALLRTNQFEAARQVIAAAGWIWTSIDAGEGHTTYEDADYFLMRLRETSSLGVPRPKDDWDAAATAEVYLFAFATIGRVSIDRGNWDHAADVLATLAEAGQYTRIESYGRIFGSHKRALALTLLAWILQTTDSEDDGLRGRQRCLEEVARMFEEAPIWESLVVAHDESFQRAIGASWWELNRREVRGRSAGIIEIDRFIRMAALLVGRSGRWGLPASSSQSTADLAWLVLQTLDDLENGREPRLTPFWTQQPYPRRQQLQALVDERERWRAEAIAHSPLDSERVERFRAGIDEALADPSGLTHTLADVRRPEGLDPSFGFNRLEPKFWFVQSHVHADPEELGRSLIEGLRRGEDSRIVDALFSGARMRSTNLEGMAKTVNAWFSRQSEPAGGVLITNSWRAAQALREGSTSGADMRQGEPEVLTIGEINVTMHRVFNSREPFVAAFVSPQGIEVTLGRQTADAATDRHVHSDRVVSIVRTPTDEEFEKWSANSIAKGDELRQQVVVKVLEAFDVEVRDPKLTAIWNLPAAEA